MAPKSSIKEALDAAGPRPPDEGKEQTPKRQYAGRLSDELAEMLARDLRKRFGKGFESIKAGETPAGSRSGSKKLDVNYSTELHGLCFGVSIKTISHRDQLGKGRYTHNLPRVDQEFMAEAMEYHVRQPYAVLIALYFLPSDGCTDGELLSSFASSVKKFFKRAGRRTAKHDPELFERVFIGLFDREGPGRGDVAFFDVEIPPPKRKRPKAQDLLTWSQLLDEIRGEFRKRNDPFVWANGEEELAEAAAAEVEGEEAEEG